MEDRYDRLTPEEREHLHNMLKVTILTPEEVTRLRKLQVLADYADEIKADAEYRKARKVVVASWRQAVIILAGLITAVILIKDYAAELVKFLAR